MRLKLGLLLAGALFLALTGFALGALPFIPGAEHSDAVVSHWPAALYLRQSLIADEAIPLWRETIMAGAPFAANPLNKTAYPFQWLALLLPAAEHLDLLIVVHGLLAGAGMYRWARGLGLVPGAAAVSALSYALGPRLVAHTAAGHLDLVYALAWLPWWMLTVKMLVDAPRMRAADVLGSALAASLMMLADLRLSLFGLGAGAIYALWLAISSRSARKLARLLPVGGLVLVLTASVTVPLLGWGPYLNRGALTAEEAGIYSLELPQLIGLILVPGGGSVETLTYVGLPVLALALVGAFAYRRRLLIWFVLLALALIYGLGLNSLMWRALADLFSPLLWFRVPARAWLLAALIIPLLAGYGAQALGEQVERVRRGERWHGLKRARLLLAAWTMAALVLGLLVLLAVPLPPVSGLTLVIGGVGIGLIALLGLSGRLAPRWLTPLLLLVTFADLAIFGRAWLEWRDEEAWVWPYAPLAERLSALEPDRIYSPDYSLPQQVAEWYGLRLFGGVDPFQIAGVSAAIAEAGGITTGGYSVVQPPLTEVVVAPDTEKLAAWGISHVVARAALEDDGLRLIESIGGAQIYANLDYVARAAPTSIPDWPGVTWDSAPAGVPTGAQIDALNQQTGLAVLIGAVSLLACAGTWAFMRVKAA